MPNHALNNVGHISSQCERCGNLFSPIFTRAPSRLCPQCLRYLRGSPVDSGEPCSPSSRECIICGSSSILEGVFEWDFGPFCEVCIDSGIIHPYTYKPAPQFLLMEEEQGEATMLYGIELEVEYINSRILFKLLETVLKLPKKVVYCKKDSSIDFGFEIVSHPGSFRWWKENLEIVENILSIRTNGYRSFNTNTCGIHIHMDKSFFTPSDIQKLHDFFRYNPGFVLMISQRVKSKLERWAGIYHPGDAKVYYKCINKRGSSERHVAINLNPEKTVEIRIFRGTLNIKSFYKNIEFCDALYLFIKEVSMKECILENFLKFVIFNKEKYNNLFEFLKSRSMFVGDGI